MIHVAVTSLRCR